MVAPWWLSHERVSFLSLQQWMQMILAFLMLMPAAVSQGAGTLLDPVSFTEPEGSFSVGSGGLGDTYYAVGEDKWWRVAPCEGNTAPCQVLLWFTGYETPTVDYLYIWDGGDALPTNELGGVVDEAGCVAERCLHRFSGDNIPTVFEDGGGAPDMLRSTSPVIWVHWIVSPQSSPGKGFTAHYSTDSPHGANLTAGDGLVLEVSGDLLSTTPPYSAGRLAYTAQLPEGATGITVTAKFVGGLLWEPYTVTLPAARQGETMGPVVGFINGEPCSSGTPKDVTFTAGLEHQPLVVSVRARDEYTFWDYVVMVTPAGVTDTYGERCYAADEEACATVELSAVQVTANAQCGAAGACTYVQAIGLSPQDCVASASATCAAIAVGLPTSKANCTAIATCAYTPPSDSALALATRPDPTTHVVGGAEKWIVPSTAEASTMYATPIEAVEGDIIKFQPGTTASFNNQQGVKLIAGIQADGTEVSQPVGSPPCPAGSNYPTNEVALSQTGDSSVEFELDTPGTYFFAGMTRQACQLGQYQRVNVAPGRGLSENSPQTAKSVTTPVVQGTDLVSWDQPIVTGTQWDTSGAVSTLSSLAGWNGFFEWFEFDAHQDEHVEMRVVFHDDVHFATGMLWNQALKPLAVLSTTPAAVGREPFPCRPPSVAPAVLADASSWRNCDFDQATVGSERNLAFDFVAPKTDKYLVSVRTFLTAGASVGNYSVRYSSDWVNKCETPEVVDCGSHGTCEIKEDPPGVYTPFCSCLERWRGEQCEIAPPEPAFLKLSGSTAIEGTIAKDKFSTAGE